MLACDRLTGPLSVKMLGKRRLGRLEYLSGPLPVIGVHAFLMTTNPRVQILGSLVLTGVMLLKNCALVTSGVLATRL